VVVGSAASRRELVAIGDETFRPWLLLAQGGAGASRLPHFEGRNEAGTALAYLCENMTCLLPAKSPAELRSQLAPA
jgi:uncharacterized protein YyaL (SSP411 family)